jgi:hypothetical protein
MSHWTDFLLAPTGFVTEYIVEDENGEWQCKCGNKASLDGFQPCDEIGQITEPTIGGDWDGKHYVCERCYTIIDGDTLQITGKCSTDAVNKNMDFMFE